eukprot:9188041-Alexandrium_andersonii.AAC.1
MRCPPLLVEDVLKLDPPASLTSGERVEGHHLHSPPPQLAEPSGPRSATPAGKRRRLCSLSAARSSGSGAV